MEIVDFILCILFFFLCKFCVECVMNNNLVKDIFLLWGNGIVDNWRNR